MIDVLLHIEEIVRRPQRDAVDEDDAPREVVLGGTDVLLDVRPLGPATLLVTQDALAELFVPDAGRGQIDGLPAEAQSFALGIGALARALAASDEMNVAHR